MRIRDIGHQDTVAFTALLHRKLEKKLAPEIFRNMTTINVQPVWIVTVWGSNGNAVAEGHNLMIKRHGTNYAFQEPLPDDIRHFFVSKEFLARLILFLQ